MADATEERSEKYISGAQRGKGGPIQLRNLNARSFSPAKQALFLEQLAATANVRQSARTAAVTEQTVWLWRRKNAAFLHAFQQALSQGYADMEIRAQAQCRFGETMETETSTLPDGTVRTVTRRDGTANAIRMLALHRAEAIAIRSVEQSGRPPLSPAEHARLVAKVDAALDAAEARMRVRDRGAQAVSKTEEKAGDDAC